MAAEDNTLKIKIVGDFDDVKEQLKNLGQLANSNGVSKSNRKTANSNLDKVSGKASALEGLFNAGNITSADAIKGIQGIYADLAKVTLSLMQYSSATKAELERLETEIQQKRDELNKKKDEYNNLKGKPNKIIYSGREKDENGNWIPGTEKSIDQISVGKDVISGIVKENAPLLDSTKINTKGALEDIANGKDKEYNSKEEMEQAAAAIVKVNEENARTKDLLNTNLQAQQAITSEIEKQSNLLDKKNEDANPNKGADASSLEDLNIKYGQLEAKLKDLQAAYAALSAEQGKSNDEQGKTESQTNKTTEATKKQDNVVAKAVKSFFGYQQIIRVLRTVMNFTVKTITDLDKALTDQAIVSGLSRSQVYGLVNSYESLAKQTGFTTTEIAATASKFLQQGKTVSNTLKLTKAAAESARVAGISASQAVDYLTTALNGFQMSADQSLEVSDKFAAIAASSATSYEELATALSKVAAQANLAGMSMDYTLALLGKGIETTRESAESIGTALKTVIARMREITDYGVTLSDGTDVNNVETQLKAVGISLRDNAGELRSTQDVLNELGLKWDSLSKNQQASLAKALAGTRQQSRLISMMNDYDRTLELLEISQNSLGATEAQQTKYMQSMAAAANSVQVAWQGLVTTLTKSQQVIDVVNGFSKIIDGLNKNTDLLYSAIVLITIGLIAFFVAQTFANAAVATAETIQNKNVFSILALLVAKKLETGATFAETAAQWGLNASFYACPVFWIAAGLLLLTGIVIGLAAYFGNLKTANEKSIDSMKELTAEAYNFKKTASDFDSVVDAFDKVDEKVIKTAADMKSLSETADKTKELLNNLNTSDSRDSGFLKSIFGTDDKDTITNLIESASDSQLEKWAKLASEEARKKADAANKGVIKEAIKNQDVLNTSEGLDLTKNAIAQLGYSSIKQIGKEADMTSETIANLGTTWEAMVDSMDASDIAGKTQSQLESMGANFMNYMKSINKNQLATFYDSSAAIKDRVAAYNEITSGMSSEMLKEFNSAYPQFKNLIDTYGSAIQNGIVDSLGISTDALNQFAEDLSDLEKSLNFTISDSNRDKMMSAIGTMIEQGASFDDIVKMLEKDFSLTATQAAAVAGAMGTAAANGKTVLDSTETQTKLASKASNLRETQGKWSTMTDSEKNEYIANHSDFFQQEGALSAFESGADITSYIKGAYGEDQQKLIQQYKAQEMEAASKMSEAQDEINKAMASGDDIALKAAQEKYDAAKEQYREAKTFGADAQKIYNMSIAEIVKKQETQLSTYKSYLKDQQTELINSLNARKQAYQDYFDAINSAYEENDFATKEARLQQQIVKLSGGTDATSQNKILELSNSLADLQKNHSETQRKNAQQAVLDNINDEIDVINNYYDEMLDNNQELLNMLNGWLNSGKSSSEYESYLRNTKHYTEDEITQAMTDFNAEFADNKVAESSWINKQSENTTATQENTDALLKQVNLQKMQASTSLLSSMYGLGIDLKSMKEAPSIITSGNSTFINFDGKTYDVSGKSDNINDFIMALIKSSKTVPTT